MTAMPACFRSLLLIGFFPFSNGSVGAVDAHAPCIFLFDGGAVVTYAFVGQSYGAVAAGAVTNRRGVAASRGCCCAGVACCSTCCATGACCGCACCVVCSCRCCAAAWLRFLCSQGAFFCCIGSSIATCCVSTARGCACAVGAALAHRCLVFIFVRRCCSRSQSRVHFLSWFSYPNNYTCYSHVWPHKHVRISLLPAVDHYQNQQTNHWLF